MVGRVQFEQIRSQRDVRVRTFSYIHTRIHTYTHTRMHARTHSDVKVGRKEWWWWHSRNSGKGSRNYSSSAQFFSSSESGNQFAHTKFHLAPLVRASHLHAADAGSIPRCGKGFFSLPESSFSVDSLTGVRAPPCAMACIYICAHVKDLVVHVRVWWIKETLKHSACTVGRVARLCCSGLFPGKATRISHGRNPIGTIQL